jgi:CheY-like chemotaxis protein
MEQKTALIAEDSAINRQLLRILLTKAGFAVLEAEDGKKAVEIFNNEKPDIVFMDVRMPVMDGYEATRQIRNSDPTEIPIVFVTASVFAEDQSKAKAAGASGFMSKPYLTEDLHRILDQFF